MGIMTSIKYADNFVMRIVTDHERHTMGLTPEYTWVYDVQGVKLFLTSEEASRFVLEIGKDVTKHRK